MKHPMLLLFGAGATRGALAEKSPVPPPVDGDFFELVGRLEGHGTQTLASRVKRVLRKYGYASDKPEKATQTVLQQAELLCADWASRQKRCNPRLKGFSFLPDNGQAKWSGS